MADVFISYHEASAGELAEEIADRLEDAGISCWCARRDMPLGGDFARAIPSRIHDCRLFLLILNESVYHSEHIESEVGIAFSRRNKKEDIRILPLEIGDFTRKDWVEYYLIHAQSVKFPENPDEQRIQRLVKQIARLLAKEPAPKQKPKPKPSPAKIVKRGKCGDNVNFTLDENGVLTISGTGPMWDFVLNADTNTVNTPWWNEHESISCIQLLDNVSAIGIWAFRDCAGVTSVTISDSVTKIKTATFEGCARLTNVTIPDSVTTIGAWAFSATGLTSVMIPKNVTTIEESTFYKCKELKNVTISDNVTTIERWAFNCTGLTSIFIPDSVSTIGDWAFGGCVELTNVSVPAKADISLFAFPPHVRVTRRG